MSAASLLAAASHAAESAKKPATDPLAPENYFILADAHWPDLSPDGTHLAFRTQKTNYSFYLTMVNLTNDHLVTKFQEPEFSPHDLLWLGNGRLMVMTSRGLFSYNPDTGEDLDVADYTTTFTDVLTRTGLLKPLRNRPNHVLISYGRANEWSLFEVDGTGQQNAKAHAHERSLVRKFAGPKGEVVAWYQQPDGEVRGCMVQTEKNRSKCSGARTRPRTSGS